jgi:hypothetical protein
MKGSGSILGRMSDSHNAFSIRRLFDAFRGSPSSGLARPDERTQPPPFRVRGAAELAAEPLRRVWDILEAKRQGRTFLRRSDIDPGELVFVLPLIGLIEVHQPPLRFRHRLVGTGYRDALGFEATGLWTEEWPHLEQRALIVRCYVATVEAREAIGFRTEFGGDKKHLRYEALLMPLAADGETIDMLFVAAAPILQTGTKP